MLVRHVLSQLSYAPKSQEVITSATRHIIDEEGRFVKHYFRIFSKNFPLSKTPCSLLIYRLSSIFWMSAGLKL